MTREPKESAPVSVVSAGHRCGRRRRSWRFRVAALALGVIAAVGIAELSLRIAGIGFPNLYEPDEFCGSRLRKSTSGVWTKEGHGAITINSLGFRGSEFPLNRDPDEKVFRIVVAGDSFIEALQVNEEATFCVRLQSLLNNQKPNDSVRYEIINAGVSGYGTAQEFYLLRHYLLPLKPDAVLLAVYPENDIRNNSLALDGPQPRPYFQLSESGELAADWSFHTHPNWLTANTAYERNKVAIINRSRLLQVLQQLRTSSDIKSPPANPEEALRAAVEEASCVYRPGSEPAEAEAWKITELLIAKFAAECRSHETPLFVMDVSSSIQVWPAPDLRKRIAESFQIEDLFYAERRLQEVCSSRSIPFFPLASEMQRQAEIREEFLHGFPNTTKGVGHWNEAGNAIAAELVANWLRPQLVRNTEVVPSSE